MKKGEDQLILQWPNFPLVFTVTAAVVTPVMEEATHDEKWLSFRRPGSMVENYRDRTVNCEMRHPS
jgi:hypothetical protein